VVVVAALLQVVADISRTDTACVRPVLQLWNARLRQVFAAPPPLTCSAAERNWVDVDNASLRIDDAAVKRHGSVDCHYTPVHRGRNDHEVHHHHHHHHWSLLKIVQWKSIEPCFA